MESSNRMLPCIYAKLITAKQNCKATFHSLSNLEVILVLLWVYRSLDPCSAIYTDSAVSCSSLNRTRVMFRPHASVCEDSTARFCRTFLKRIPLGVIVIGRYKYFPSQYAYFYTACVACCSLHMQWLVFRVILLSGDVETNPGPETLDFCTWNLNSIIAHDYLRVSLIEAYNSVYNYDLIGIVETHLDSTVE